MFLIHVGFLCREPYDEWREGHRLGDMYTWEVGSQGAGDSALVAEAETQLFSLEPFNATRKKNNPTCKHNFSGRY